MKQAIVIYLDTDANGDDLRDSVGNSITAGWYRYEWPLQGAAGDPDGPFESEALASERLGSIDTCNECGDMVDAEGGCSCDA